MANPLVNGPGRVLASQIDLHSGAATFSYPLELPPGPEGFQPQLELTYNSASVDEMKNKRDVGSWVGTGWELHLGRISLDLLNKIYYLDFNGLSYKLVTADGVNFRTNPDQNYMITRSGNTWEMRDRGGNYYRFGGDANHNSEQFLTNSTYYRWDLSLMRDPNGNEATVSYVQDTLGTYPNNWVRSAYPEYLRYSNTRVEVHFVTGGAVNRGADGYLRLDNPLSYGSNPAPKVMENRELDYIEIRVGGSLVRKYDFSYSCWRSCSMTAYHPASLSA